MRISRRRIAIVPALAVAAILSGACESSEPTASGVASREWVDGVEVVTSRGKGRFAAPLFDLEEAVELAQDPAREESLLYEVSDFARGGDGSYYVADGGNGRIAVFGTDGDYVRTFGRAGEGPGEFGPWIRLVGSLRDEIQVFDVRKQHTLRFAFDGTFQESVSLVGAGRLDALVYEADGTRVLTRDLTERQQDLVLSGSGMQLYPPGAEEPGADVATGVTPSLVFSQVDNDDGSVAVTSVQIPFAGTNQVLRQGDVIVAVDGEGGEVAWHDASGAPFRRARLAEARVTVTPDLQAAFEEAWKRRRERLAEEGTRFVAPLPDLWYPELAGVWRDARIDDAGYLWLRDAVQASRRNDGDPHRFWVMGPDGELLGHVDTPTSQFRVQGGTLLTIEEDEDSGETRLRVLRLQPRPEGFSYPLSE